MHYNFRLFWRTFYRSFFASKNTPARLVKKRIAFLALFYLIWVPGSLVHWFCFWLDDIFFPAHKTQPIEKPLFILGNLRSGSTFLHRLLSRDSETFTSLTTWDPASIKNIWAVSCIASFSPSIARPWERSRFTRSHSSNPKKTRTFTCTSGMVISLPSSSPSWTSFPIISTSTRRFLPHISAVSCHSTNPCCSVTCMPRGRNISWRRIQPSVPRSKR